MIFNTFPHICRIVSAFLKHGSVFYGIHTGGEDFYMKKCRDLDV